MLKNTQHLNILHNISKGTGHSTMLFLCFYNEVKIEKILIFKEKLLNILEILRPL